MQKQLDYLNSETEKLKNKSITITINFGYLVIFLHLVSKYKKIKGV